MKFCLISININDNRIAIIIGVVTMFPSEQDFSRPHEPSREQDQLSFPDFQKALTRKTLFEVDESLRTDPQSFRIALALMQFIDAEVEEAMKLFDPSFGGHELTAMRIQTQAFVAKYLLTEDGRREGIAFLLEKASENKEGAEQDVASAEVTQENFSRLLDNLPGLSPEHRQDLSARFKKITESYSGISPSFKELFEDSKKMGFEKASSKEYRLAKVREQFSDEEHYRRQADEKFLEGSSLLHEVSERIPQEGLEEVIASRMLGYFADALERFRRSECHELLMDKYCKLLFGDAQTQAH